MKKGFITIGAMVVFGALCFGFGRNITMAKLGDDNSKQTYSDTCENTSISTEDVFKIGDHYFEQGYDYGYEIAKEDANKLLADYVKSGKITVNDKELKECYEDYVNED